MKRSKTFEGVFAGADADEVMRMINNSGEVFTDRPVSPAINEFSFKDIKLRFDRLITSLLKENPQTINSPIRKKAVKRKRLSNALCNTDC